jgi:DNA invertase Pin-like site-specific DNA recombinase
MNKHGVFYFRVSTRKQFDSNLGLEGQREAVRRYSTNNGIEPLAEFTEVESGKNNMRPQLVAALDLCKRSGATLVVSKLDRLSRNAVFLLQLQQSNVEFICCDCPNVDRFTVGILALVAQRERELISERTCSALTAARARGQRFGNPRWQDSIAKMNAGARAARVAYAKKILPIINEIRESGVETLQGLADCLNRRGIFTRNQKLWHPSSIKRVMA